MTKFLLTLLLTASLNSCAQESKRKAMTAEQRIEYLSNKVQKFSYEPIYELDIQSAFSFRVMVNGVPVYSNFDVIPGIVRVNINSSILKSGKQNIEVELYPGYDHNGTLKGSLDNGENFILKIEKAEWNKDGSLETPEDVPEFKNTDKNIDYSKLTEFKTTLSFDASVPYTIKGWGEGEDLSTLNQKELELKIASFYENTVAAFKEKDYDYLNTIFFKRGHRMVSGRVFC